MKHDLAFQRVILYARQHRANPWISKTLKSLGSYLSQLGVAAFLERDTAEHFVVDLPSMQHDHMGQDGDLIMVVGGDGSMLSAARLATPINVPVLGINRGRLGFLTDISPTELEAQLTPILKGRYKEEQRFLLAMSLHEGHIDASQAPEGIALNDIVLNRGQTRHLVAFDVYINEQFVSHYRADGLIISTPTGSTAYALSAGGPIMHPALEAMVLVPMFSHSLNSRPLVVHADSTLMVKINPNNEHQLQLSCDGHESHAIQPGQSISIKKFSKTLRLLHPYDYHYYDTLRVKLGWGSKPQG